MLCKFLSRKLLVFLLGFGSGILLCVFGKLDSTASTFICTMTGVYLAGNVVNGIKNIYGGGDPTQTPPQAGPQ